MKYLSITFDDGREDNYSVAFSIMKQAHMKGTVYVTTGFIDGTWENAGVLDSPRRALTIEEIRELLDNGWEIGLHGDKHTTELDDFNSAYLKLNHWINQDTPGTYGFSVPNSSASDEAIAAIRDQKDRVLYIRKGRRRDNSGFVMKALYALAYYGRLQWAYNRYNRNNLYLAEDADKIMYSVVVKAKDRPEMILRFLDTIPEGTGLVLMLHSVIPPEEANRTKSPWIWTEDRLKTLCKQLTEKKKQVQVVTARDMVRVIR